MLLNERSKYGDIQEKMKKKKLENGLLARDLERLEEQLLNKKNQINRNNLLLQYWQKEVMKIFVSIEYKSYYSLGNGYRTKYQTTRSFHSSISSFQIC